MKKTFIAFLLAVVMIVAAVPVSTIFALNEDGGDDLPAETKTVTVRVYNAKNADKLWEVTVEQPIDATELTEEAWNEIWNTYIQSGYEEVGYSRYIEPDNTCVVIMKEVKNVKVNFCTEDGAVIGYIDTVVDPDVTEFSSEWLANEFYYFALNNNNEELDSRFMVPEGIYTIDENNVCNVVLETNPDYVPTETPVPTEGLVGFYKFDGTLENEIGDGEGSVIGKCFGEPVGDATYENGKLTTSTEVSDGYRLDATVSDDFTVSLFCQLDNFEPNSPMVWIGGQDQTNESWIGIWNAIFSNRALSFGSKYGDQSWVNVDSYIENFPTPEIFVTITVENGVGTLYHNGIKIGDTSWSTDEKFPDPWTDNSGCAVYVGVNAWDSASDATYDNLTVYDRALTAAEVRALYAAGGDPTDTEPETKEVTVTVNYPDGEEAFISVIEQPVDAAELDETAVETLIAELPDGYALPEGPYAIAEDNTVVIVLVGEEHIHSGDCEYHSNLVCHWYVCGECGCAYEKEAHDVSEWIIGRMPTIFKNGYMYKECVECGYVVAEMILPALDFFN